MNRRQQYRAGMSAYNAGRFGEAVEHLAPLAQDQGGAEALLSRFYAAQANYRLALQLFKLRRYREAAARFQAAAVTNPDGNGFGKYLVACHVRSQRYDLAAGELETALNGNPDDVETRVRLALAQWKLGNRLEASATLRRGLERTPDSADLHYHLGVLSAGEDKLGAAEEHFRKAIAIDPGHAGAFERLAQICSVENRHERALRYLERAHRLRPENRRILWQLSLLAEMLPNRLSVRITEPARPGTGDTAALERLGELMTAEPDFLEAFLSVPESEVDEEVFSTLAAILERSLQKHPEFADLHYHCGVIYRRLGRSDDAIQHAEQAVSINPRYVNALILLAQLYGQTDRLGAGIERLEQAIAAGGDYPDVHYMIGQLYQTAGEAGRARAAYERALDLNREYAAARQALVSLAV